MATQRKSTARTTRGTTSGTDNEQIVRMVYDLFNNRNIDQALNYAGKDLQITNMPFNMKFQGRDGFRQWMEGWLRAFPDARADIKNMASSGDQVVVEYAGRGTHNGILATPLGDIAPTGKKIDLNFCDVLQLRDGQLISWRSYFDSASLLRQAGVYSLQPQQRGSSTSQS
jgi:steroid delta-isomerase-like uncharacterized protein